MKLFKRLFKVTEAEAHSLVDKLEDPIKLTEQGIRDMKGDLQKSLEALAELKAMSIRAKREADNFKREAENMESKAIALLKQAESGNMDVQEADRLATAALQKKEENMKQYQRSLADNQKFEESVAKMGNNISHLKSSISKWENELKTLKARAKVSQATKNVNKQMANIDSGGTVAMLERMRSKVEQDEALAESYGDIALESKSVDDEINKALNDSSLGANDALADLKSKMGIGNTPPAE